MGIEELIQMILQKIGPEALVQFLQIWEQLSPEEKQQFLEAITNMAQQGQQGQGPPPGQGQGPPPGQGQGPPPGQGQREQNLYG